MKYSDFKLKMLTIFISKRKKEKVIFNNTQNFI